MEKIIQDIIKNIKVGQSTRATIVVDEKLFDRLKEITDIKQIFIKDVINELIDIYNTQAITDPDFQKRVEEEKSKLSDEIKKLIELQKEKSKEESEKSNSNTAEAP